MEVITVPHLVFSRPWLKSTEILVFFKLLLIVISAQVIAVLSIHASIMYNSLEEIENIKTLVQIGIRDFSGNELEIINNSHDRIITYFDRDIKFRRYE